MATGYVLTNKKAGNGQHEKYFSALEALYDLPLTFTDVSDITDYAEYFKKLGPEDFLVLAGGDGTLNRFINNTWGLELPEDIRYYPIGTGNDFARELGKSCGDAPFPIRQYLDALPQVEVKGRSYLFINGIGFGIDGYCADEGDKLRSKGAKKVNYTAIAIKGLLFRYKPTGASITVDGRKYTYKKAWLAPTMFGKCYGGGMIPTPDQDRTRTDSQLSVMVFHDCGKLRTLTIFPSIFKGQHTRYTGAVEILEGKDISVEFDRPTPLQIDGETIQDVTSYHAAVGCRATYTQGGKYA